MPNSRSVHVIQIDSSQYFTLLTLSQNSSVIHQEVILIRSSYIESSSTFTFTRSFSHEETSQYVDERQTFSKLICTNWTRSRCSDYYKKCKIIKRRAPRTSSSSEIMMIDHDYATYWKDSLLSSHSCLLTTVSKDHPYRSLRVTAYLENDEISSYSDVTNIQQIWRRFSSLLSRIAL